MSPIKHNKIHFPFSCKFFKKSFFSKSSILNVDKNRKHFNPIFIYEDLKKIVENLIMKETCSENENVILFKLSDLPKNVNRLSKIKGIYNYF